MRSSALFLAAIVLLASHPAHGDELKLKDGTKVVGTIVGYEEDSFKVQTSYGFAVVKKDQVLSIGIAAASVPAAAAKDPIKDAAKGLADNPTKPPSADSREKKPEIVKAAPPALAKAPAPEKPSPVMPPPSTLLTGSSVGDSSAPPVSAIPTARKPPASEPIRENVTGNVYTNLTYGFRMFKPPDWDVIAAAPSLMPGAIAAMGTQDQDTYLLVGQGDAGKTPAMEMDATEKRLHDVLDNFRPLGEQHIMVSGAAAIEHRFRGGVDDRDWSGIIVIVPHDQKLYTIFGMTRADTDLVQIQENVIARTIASLQFTAQ